MAKAIQSYCMLEQTLCVLEIMTFSLCDRALAASKVYYLAGAERS